MLIIKFLRTINKVLWITVFALVTLFIANKICFGNEFFEVDELSIHYSSFFQGSQDPLLTQSGLPNRQLDKQLDLHLDTSVFQNIYWNNRIHSFTDNVINTNSGQFRAIGLSMNIGIKIFNWLDFGYTHFSEHLLDTTYQYGGFPRQDGVEMIIYLINNKKRDNLF